MKNLFRAEALESHQQLWLGSVQLIRPLPLRILTVFVVLVALAVGAYLVMGQYTRKSHVSGYLVPDAGVIRLLPPRTGTLLERRADEGQHVRQGDVLFVLSVDSVTLGGDTQAAVKQSLAARERSLRSTSQQQTQLLRDQAAALERRVGDMRRELAQMDAEAELHEQRLKLARQAHARLESLRAENFISHAQVQAKSEELLGLQAQLQAVHRQRATHLREIGTLEAQRRELPLRAKVQQDEIDRQLAALAQEAAESDARQRVVVRAPQDGVLAAVLAEPGQSVTPELALASLVPAKAKLIAHLYAPSSAVGFLRADQQVLLRYEAFPYQKFGHQPGRVVQVSKTPLQQAELAGLPLPGVLSGAALGVGGEPLYRVTVSLDRQSVQAYGVEQPLAAGMQLEADVLLESRRLVEWIFEPLLTVAGRV
jgi:membrane fusion protein